MHVFFCLSCVEQMIIKLLIMF